MKILLPSLSILLFAATTHGAANENIGEPPYPQATSVEELDQRIAHLINKHPSVKAFDETARTFTKNSVRDPDARKLHKGVGDYNLSAFLSTIARGRNLETPAQTKRRANPEPLNEENMLKYVEEFNTILQNNPAIDSYIKWSGQYDEPRQNKDQLKKRNEFTDNKFWSHLADTAYNFMKTKKERLTDKAIKRKIGKLNNYAQ